MKKSTGNLKFILLLLLMVVVSVGSIIMFSTSLTNAYAATETSWVALDPQNGDEITDYFETPIGEKLPVGHKKPELYGNVFLGYYEKEQGIGTDPGNKYYDENMLPCDVWDKEGENFIYAHWKPEQKTVVLNMQGGYNGTTYVTGTYGFTLPSGKIKPEYEGYNFLGYFEKKQSEGSSKQYYYSDMGPVAKWENTDIIEIFAHWEGVKSKVIFDKNGGDAGSNAIDVVFGDPMPQNQVKPQRKGYRFIGYFEKPQSEGVINNTQYYNENMVSAHKWDKLDAEVQTLYAHWELIEYTITYNFNGAGKVSNPTTYTVETPTFTLTPPQGSPKTGYKYKWDTPQIVQGTAGNLVLNAVPRPIQYHLYFENVGNALTYPPYYGQWCDYDVEYTASRDWIQVEDGYEFDAWILTNKQTNVQTRVGTGMTYTFKNLSSTEGDYFDLRANYIKKSCVTEGTLITLADGTQKAVEKLNGNEMLLVWDMQAGSFSSAPILFIDSDEVSNYQIINLSFSDGTMVSVIDEHAFWDCNLNEYVFLREDAAQYIGHWFEKQTTNDSGKLLRTRVQLSSVEISYKYTTAWSPVSYGHLCYYVNGMLSMPGATQGLINIFEVDSATMTYDKEAYERDIETYGLYTYEEFCEIMPVSEEVFNAFNGQYLKVAIGKNLLTENDLITLYTRYSKFLS